MTNQSLHHCYYLYYLVKKEKGNPSASKSMPWYEREGTFQTLHSLLPDIISCVELAP